jgi:hypothetical protein
MYALVAICNALSPSRLDENITNIVKERYGEQFSRMVRGYVFIHRRAMTAYLMMFYTAKRASLLSRNSSYTRAQSSSPPTRRHIKTQSNWLHTPKMHHPNLPNDICPSFWLTCERMRLFQP